MHRPRISAKLHLLLLVVSLVLVVSAIISTGIEQSNRSLLSVYKEHLVTIDRLHELRNHQMGVRLDEMAAQMEQDPFEVLAHIDAVRSHGEHAGLLVALASRFRLVS